MRLRTAIGAALLLVGCDATVPEGQVAARVDGIEITDRELLSEAATNGGDLANPAGHVAMLNRLIDRKLLARAAQAALADQVPAVQIEARRTREDVLARAYAHRITTDLAPPSTAQIDRAISENPHRFARRTSYLLDRLVVARDVGPLLASGSVEAAVQALDRVATPYRRQLVLIDSDTLSSAENARFAAQVVGETQRAAGMGGIALDTLILKRPFVETTDAQRARARSILIQARSTAAVSAALRGLRAEADIAVRASDMSKR